MADPTAPTTTLEDPTLVGETDAATLRRAVSMVTALVGECHLRVGPEGLSVTAMDPATVAMVDLELSAAAFDRYEADEAAVAVDIERLSEALSVADVGDDVRLSVSTAEGRLAVSFDEVSYSVGLLAPESVRSPPELSELTYEDHAELTLRGGDVSRIVDAADMVASTVELGVDGSTASFYAVAEGDVDDVSLSRSVDDLDAMDPTAAELLFSLEYLRAVERELPSEAAVDLRIGTEAPLSADCAFADAAGRVEYVVSPRITTR
ncbi:MAG: DNA polymerase sliding clamp [Halolamina sp.]